MLKDKKILIFDFDGTIIDSTETVWGIFNEMSFEKVSRENWFLLRDLPTEELFRKFHIPKWRLPFVVRKARKKLNAKMLSIPFFDGMESILRQLKNRYRLGIVTSNSAGNVKFYLENKGLDVFDFVYSVSIFGKSKTLKKILKKYEADSNEALYIGDETRDVEAARKAEMQIVSVCWGFNSRSILEKYKPDYLVDRPEELLELLNG